MIDFTSTSAGADPQTVRCARLLAAVIVQAIRDAAEPLQPDERDRGRNLHYDASESVAWLFGPAREFGLYAELIGSSAPAIASALLDSAHRPTGPAAGLTSAQARTIRARVRMWRLGESDLSGDALR